MNAEGRGAERGGLGGECAPWTISYALLGHECPAADLNALRLMPPTQLDDLAGQVSFENIVEVELALTHCAWCGPYIAATYSHIYASEIHIWLWICIR